MAKKLIPNSAKFNPLKFFRKMKNHESTAEEHKSETEPIEQNDAPLTEGADAPSEGRAESEIEKLQAEIADLKDKTLRIYSEFDNYKKRTAKERIDLQKSAGAEIIMAMLPIVDDFERAIRSISETSDISALKEGVILIYNKLKSTLEAKGLEEMKSLGQPFDSDIHEAITNIPAPSDDLKDKVVDEVEKGYYLNGKVLRYAKVVVGQ